MALQRFRTLAIALFAQLSAAVLVLGFCGHVSCTPVGILLALVQGLMAAVFGFMLALPAWWVPIHILLPMLGWALLTLPIAPEWYLATSLILVLVFGMGPLTSGVPLYISPQSSVLALDRLIGARRGVRVLDAGSGIGSMLIALGRLRPDAVLEGVESGLGLWFLSRIRAAWTKIPARISWGNLWTVDFGAYDVVYAFLSPAPMTALWEKARRELRPGALLVSLEFSLPERAPIQVIDLDGSNRRLYVWQQPQEGG